MPRSLTATLRACLDGTRRENFPPINPWWWRWWTRISSLSRIVVLGFVPRHAHNSPIGDRFLFRLPAFDENRSGRERHSAKKFLSDDLHVEANDRKSRFMSFTLMLTLWPLTYHFFPHRWKLRRAAYNRTHHGVATMHADAIRLIVRTRPKIVLSLASPEKESCPGQSSFSTSPIKFESLSI